MLAVGNIHLGRCVVAILGKTWLLMNRQAVDMGRVGSVLSDTGQVLLNQLCRDNVDVFSKAGTPPGRCVSPPMTIQTTGLTISQPSDRTPLLKRNLISECIDDMLAQGVIRRCVSPWSSPIT